MRLTTDIFEYCREHVPKWNTISISGYHIREKGCSAVQEVAFTLSNAIAYVRGGARRAASRSTSSPRGSPSSSTATTTSSRRSPSSARCGGCGREIMRERFGATDERSQTIRFHTQTGGVDAPGPAARGQHHPGRAPGLRRGLPAAPSRCTRTASTRRWRCRPSARRGSRCAPSRCSPTSRARPTPPTRSPAPTSSSRSPTRSRQRAWELIDKVEELGGSVEALEFIQREIEESAASYHERYRSGQDIIVGVNKYVTEEVDDVEILKIDPETERRQVERLSAFKAARDQEAVDARLEELREVAARRGQPAAPDQGGAARPAPRSARCAARCARCSASTGAGRSSRAARRDPAARAGASPSPGRSLPARVGRRDSGRALRPKDVEVDPGGRAGADQLELRRARLIGGPEPPSPLPPQIEPQKHGPIA